MTSRTICDLLLKVSNLAPELIALVNKQPLFLINCFLLSCDNGCLLFGIR